MKRHTLVITLGALGFLAACEGEPGEPGAAGAMGPRGAPGDGTVCWDRDSNGTCSSSEDADRSGDCDVADCLGPRGLAGPAGPQGAAGPVGGPGVVGPVGPQGAAGPAGAVGPRGFAGATGALGPQGAQGAVGPQGAKGVGGPRANLLAEWELDEDAGAVTFVDGSGLRNHLTASMGAVTAGSAVAHAGKSIAFAGTEGVQVPAGNTLVDSAQIWPDLWLRTSQPGGTYTLLEKAGSFRLRLVAGVLQWTVSTTGGACTISHDVQVPADQWVHVGGLFDGLTVAVEQDGVTRSTQCRSGRLVAQPGAALTVGGKYNGAVWSEVFRGNLDELRLRSNADQSVGRVKGACAVGQGITSIAPDGAITCTAITPQRVFRYNVVDTFLESCCWAADNDAALYAGVNPSAWTDGGATASNISSSAEVLRTLFTRRLFPGANALVSVERWKDNSSTNGRVTLALMRIQNSTASPQNWTPYFYFTAYGSWGEWASVAVNGANVWTSGGGNYHINATVAPTLTLPANQISTVIFVVPSGIPWSSGGQYRMTQLLFYNDSLNLPPGLSFVDDLDTVQGNLW